MSNLKLLFVSSLLIFFAGFNVSITAQRPYRVSDRQVELLLNNIENRSNTFRSNLDYALDRSQLNGTQQEDEINRYVQDFENATDRLRDRFDNRSNVASDVEEVLNRAASIDSFMRMNRLNNQAQRSWNILRTDLNALARYYNVSWRWNDPANYPPTNNYYSLTGTYQLNTSRSDNIQNIAERETRNLGNNRQRVSNQIQRRLATADNLAIDVRGRSVTIASTLAPQMTITADGRTNYESTPQDRSVGITANLSGSQLTINSSGDRVNDFNATMTLVNNGQRLQVSRRIYVNQLGKDVTVNSYYDRTSTVAQLDIYRGRQNNVVRGNFIVPNNTILTAALNQELNSRTVREGDRFSTVVISPSQYRGAVIEGYVSDIERSGRFSGRAEMTLTFDRIRLRNGSEYNFAGLVESVRTLEGESVRVNNEGVVQDDDSQTSRTLTRAGIGAALGAIIGAIAGGGEGAAIGAAVGAGAGAGSVLIQGREDIELESRTELTIRASAPRNFQAIER